MSSDNDSLGNLLRLAGYGARRRNVFQSESALQWFVRQHRLGLVEAGALVMLAGQWHAHEARFDAFVIKAGEAAARRRVASPSTAAPA